MSDYEIKIYEEGFEEAQAKIGVEETTEWTGFGQTPADGLKRYYSVPDFDPETRLYAFKGDEMVGFIVSKILPEDPEAKDKTVTAQHDFPIVKKGHEKVSEVLYSKCIETLKGKGAKVIEARVGKGWLGTIEQAEKHGYKENRVYYMSIELPIEKVTAKETEAKFVDFDPVKDREQIVKIFTEKFNMTEEAAQTNFDGIIKPPEGWYAQPVLKEDDKIVARGLLYIPEDPKIATFRPLSPDPEKHFDSYLAKVTEIAKEKGSEKFQLFVGGPNMKSQFEFFKGYGFEVGFKVLIYDKEV
ncbi:MAG: hypothetical protein ACTSXA_11215 [Candidatus Heimdallarchaeota archaeon]